MNKIISTCLVVLAFLVPLFFLPFTSEFYEFNKNMLLIVSAFILLVLWLLKMALERKITFRKTVLDLPVLILAGVFILSSVFNAPNKWETLWTPLGTGTIISLTLFYFIITNNLKEDSITKLLDSLITSACLLALFSLYQFFGSKFSPNDFQAVSKWFPAGGLIPLATFLTVALSISGSQIYLRAKNPQIKNSPLPTLPAGRQVFHSFTLLLCLAGLGITIWQLLTTNKSLLLPYSTSWAIAVESFKNWRLFFLGVGPTSFLEAFSQFRPLSYNLGSLWAVRFVSSGNYYFHLLTTVGILGVVSFAWLIFKIIRTQSKFHQENNLAVFVPLLTVLVIFLFLFSNFLLLFSLYLFLALFALSFPPRGEYSETSKIASWSLFIPTTLAILACLYLIGRVYAADVYFRNSLQALARNDGTATYNSQIKAISLNPFNDNYRLAYSQTNLALAYSLANKSDLSDQDRQNITTLVQQAIQEGKNAIALNKNKVTNWENLAGIYRQLLNFAQGADQWAVTALSQAIKLDPVNPNLKLNLGGIYYALTNYDEAIRFFQQAIDVKPNFANGYYNLAWAYQQKGDFKKAYEAMQITLNLVPSNSEDYNKAREELDDLAKKIPAQEATKEAELKTPPLPVPTQEPLIEPLPYPSPVITPPIEIPQEQAAPDISPALESTP